MKRLSTLFSDSGSDAEEYDISKIKNKYKRSKNDPKDESTSSSKIVEKKSKSSSKNQMTIEAAFSKLKPVKSENPNTIERFFKKSDPKSTKTEMSASDFFSSSKKSKTITDVNDNHLEKIKNKVKVKPETDLPDNKKFVVEKSPVKDSSHVLNKTFKEKDLVTTPVKGTNEVDHLGSPSQSASKKAYVSYLNRQGPSALGSKEIPEGLPNCLSGLTFVMTGVLDSIERDDAQVLIEKHGGRVTKAISGKTSYLIVGSDAGESKINKAIQLKTKQINEDELFNLIRSATTSSKISTPKSTNKKQSTKLSNVTEEKPNIVDVSKSGGRKQSTKLSQVENESPTKLSKVKNEVSMKLSKVDSEAPTKAGVSTNIMSGKPIVSKSEKDQTTTDVKTSGMLLVDKYKPLTMKQIVGQHGDRSPANKLKLWLKNWQKNYELGFKKNGESDHFRAALLSGPPGIGKTTTAQIVSRELGFHIREYNASSSRSKSHMIEVASICGQSAKTANIWQKDLKYCIIMDEVDGMAGNEDRGGINELIQIIKTTKNPIICICNDRQAQKLRSLANYVYDLRYRQLTLEQIKATIKSVAFKEKIQIPDESLDEVIMASNFDLRQVLNKLQMWSVGNIDSETLKSDARNAQKEFKTGQFIVVKNVFSHENVKTISDKLSLFFEDYQLSGLFVQENYLNVMPYRMGNDMCKIMKRMSLAADSLAMSDIVSRKLRTTNDWGLLPLQGMYSTVIPGEYLHGHLTSKIQFPVVLGKQSTKEKNRRILSNLCSHLQNSTKGGVSNAKILAMDYGQLLVKRILTPLREGDIETTLNTLNGFNLLREDIDLLVEGTSWPRQGDLLANVSSQIKGSLTRAYNKAQFKVPYTTVSIKKARGGNKEEVDEIALGDETGEVAEEEEEKGDSIEDDVMIVKKQAKSKSAKRPTSSNPKKESVKKPRKK